MKNSAGSVPCPPCRARHGRSPRSDPPRIEEDSRRSQWLKGVLRSPGPIQRASGPHEVRYGPPRHFSLAACLCSPYTDRRPCLGRAASRRTGVGRVSPAAFLSILRGVLLLASMCGPLNFYRASIVFRSLLDPACLVAAGGSRMQERRMSGSVERVRGTHHSYCISYRKTRVGGPPQWPGVVLGAAHRDCMVW